MYSDVINNVVKWKIACVYGFLVFAMKKKRVDGHKSLYMLSLGGCTKNWYFSIPLKRQLIGRQAIGKVPFVEFEFL